MSNIVLMKRTEAVERTYAAVYLLDEDAVRAGIISALEVVAAAKRNWLSMNGAAKTMMLNLETYLNDELYALLHGTFIELEMKRKKAGKERYKNAAL